jgi:hypothetical protein
MVTPFMHNSSCGLGFESNAMLLVLDVFMTSLLLIPHSVTPYLEFQ